ncbi:MAG TPA: hypothetical protein VLX58_20850 [Bryobacteraceae bacterium]|nr:hypothetical protein [Bryobacteraceae bacterium]
MKPIQVGILMAVAAVGGGLLMKWQSSRNAAPTQPAVTAAPATPAPAAATPAPPAAPSQAQPSPFGDEQAAKEAEAPQRAKPRVSHAAAHRRPAPPREQPEMIAQNQPPAPPAPASTPAAQPQTPPAQAPEPVPAVVAPPPPPPPPRQVTLQAGMSIPVRIVEALSTDRNQIGDTFTGTLDQPLTVDGLVIAERGARIEGKIVQSQKAGRVQGLADLSLTLTHIITSDGQKVMLETEPFEKHGPSSKGEDAAKIGGGAALGAIIGAIAGGGKGAGIGTAVGAAAGGGTVAATRGKAAVIPPETRITFRLRNPVTITERRRGEN